MGSCYAIESVNYAEVITNDKGEEVYEWISGHTAHTNSLIWGYLSMIVTIVQFICTIAEFSSINDENILSSLNIFIQARLWTIVEVSYVIMNFYFSLEVIHFHNLKNIRIIASFVILIIFMKGLYYMKMIESMAPHIDIIFKIFNSISSFLLIFILAIFTLALS